MVKISLPRKLVVDDYHEFDSVTDILKQLGAKGVKVKEIGFAHGRYLGIVYTGKLTDGTNAKLVRDIKRESREYEKGEDE